MEIRSFMLVTGQELIGELSLATGTGYKVRNPLVVHMMRGQDGKPTLAFAQWSMLHDDETVELFDHALMAPPIKIIGEVADSYIQQTTGLILPTMGGQLLKG
jgi:hypothetical protein